MIKNNEKINRSVRRTQRDLRNSLIELMKKKPILRITAKEIYEAADIGRTTFYAHYKNQYDFLEEIETDTIEQIEGYLHRNAITIFNKKDIIENAIVNGTIGLIQYWLKNNMHIPVPTLAKMIVKIIEKIRS